MAVIGGLPMSTNPSVQQTGPGGSATAVHVASGDSRIDSFVARWRLDIAAQQALRQLDSATQVRVMEGFAPKELSNGTSAAFLGFVKSVSSDSSMELYTAPTMHAMAMQTAPATVTAPPALPCLGPADPSSLSISVCPNNPNVDIFVGKWGLDNIAQQALLRLDPEVQNRVIQDFAPKDVSKGASAAFMGFVRSVTSRQATATPTPTILAPQTVPVFAGMGPLPLLPGQFGLAPVPTSQDPHVLAFLQSITSASLQAQTTQFLNASFPGVGLQTQAPPLVSANGLPGVGLQAQATPLMSVGGVLGAALQPQPPSLAPVGGLSEAALHVQSTPLTCTAGLPGAGLHTQSVPVSVSGAGGVCQQTQPTTLVPAGAMSGVGLHPQATSLVPAAGLTSFVAPAPTTSFGSASETIRAAVIEAFVIQWGLDKQAQDALHQLSPDVQQKIMDGFAPTDLSHGSSVAFLDFVRGVAPGVVAPSVATVAGFGSLGGSTDERVKTFCAKWGLDSMAEESLRRLEPEVQKRVMDQFAPKDVSRGASIPFMGFVKSVLNSAPLQQIPFTGAVALTSQMALGGLSAGLPLVVANRAALEAFVIQWGLDAKAQDTLYRLDPELQQRVIRDFAPKDVSRGASAAFMGFVRSVGGKGVGPRFTPY